MTSSPRHDPVMLEEALAMLAVKPGGHYLDATIGLGGHAEAILNASSPDGRLLGSDADPAVLEASARTTRDIRRPLRSTPVMAGCSGSHGCRHWIDSI